MKGSFASVPHRAPGGFGCRFQRIARYLYKLQQALSCKGMARRFLRASAYTTACISIAPNRSFRLAVALLATCCVWVGESPRFIPSSALLDLRVAVGVRIRQLGHVAVQVEWSGDNHS